VPAEVFFLVPIVEPKAREKTRQCEFQWQANGQPAELVDLDGKYCYKIGSDENCAWRVSIDRKLCFIVTGE
jgi:hypothetical protein